MKKILMKLKDDMLANRRSVGLPFGETQGAFSSEHTHVSESQHNAALSQNHDYRMSLQDDVLKLGKNLCSLLGSAESKIALERWRM